MAEERTKLSIEFRTVLDEKTLRTSVDLEALIADLQMTEISHDAGGFVCNTLYFRTLDHLYAQEERHYSIFVHVPLLTEENRSLLAAEFCSNHREIVGYVIMTAPISKHLFEGATEGATCYINF